MARSHRKHASQRCGLLLSTFGSSQSESESPFPPRASRAFSCASSNCPIVPSWFSSEESVSEPLDPLSLPSSFFCSSSFVIKVGRVSSWFSSEESVSEENQDE